MEFAAREQWIVVSHDVNSMTAAAFAILEEGAAMHGLLMVHQRDAIGPTIESLTLISTASEAEEWIGVVEFLPL